LLSQASLNFELLIEFTSVFESTQLWTFPGSSQRDLFKFSNHSRTTVDLADSQSQCFKSSYPRSNLAHRFLINLNLCFAYWYHLTLTWVCFNSYLSNSEECYTCSKWSGYHQIKTGFLTMPRCAQKKRIFPSVEPSEPFDLYTNWFRYSFIFFEFKVLN
jgi:hypothetical protein